MEEITELPEPWKGIAREVFNEYWQKLLFEARKLRASELLYNANPFMLAVETEGHPKASNLAEHLIQRRLSHSRETILGSTQEELVRRFAQLRWGNAFKSSAPGIDIEWEDNGVRQLVNVKSTTEWANSPARASHIQSFRDVRSRLRDQQTRSVLFVTAGADKEWENNNFYVYRGNAAWRWVTGMNLEQMLIKEMVDVAQRHRQLYRREVRKAVLRCQREFETEPIKRKYPWVGMLTDNTTPPTPAAPLLPLPSSAVVEELEDKTVVDAEAA